MKWVECPECDGDGGWWSGDEEDVWTECRRCVGAGEIEEEGDDDDQN